MPFHQCGLFLPDKAYGKPLFITGPSGKVSQIFYPEKVAEWEDWEEMGIDPVSPPCGSPVYIGSVTRPSWN